MIKEECKQVEIQKDLFDLNLTVIIDVRYSVIRLIKPYIVEDNILFLDIN
jgi:hypothetical protein